MFYTQNSWYTTDVWVFTERMVTPPSNSLGGDKLPFIRDLAIDTRSFFGHRSFDYSGLVACISNRLPALQHLQLMEVVPLRDPNHRTTVTQLWERMLWHILRDFLVTVAQITQGHSILRKAVLNNRSGKIHPHAPDNCHQCVALVIDIVPKGELVPNFESACPVFRAWGVKFESWRLSAKVMQSFF